MSDAFYIQMRDGVADVLLKDFGQTLVLREEGSDAVFDGATGFMTNEGTPTNYAITGVVLNIKQDVVNGSSILDGDKQVLMSATHPTTGEALSVVPTTSMRIIDGSTVYTIIKVEPLSPGGVDVIYKLQVRE